MDSTWVCFHTKLLEPTILVPIHLNQNSFQPGMVAHASHPSAREAEAKRMSLRQPWLHSEIISQNTKVGKEIFKRKNKQWKVGECEILSSS